MRAPLVPVTLAFLVGVLVGSAMPSALGVLIGAAVLPSLIALTPVIRRAAHPHSELLTPNSQLVVLLLLWMAVGMLRVALWETHPEAQLGTVVPEEPQPVRLHGVVISDPVQPFDPAEPEPEVCVVRLWHVRAEQEVGWQPMAGRVRVSRIDPLVPLLYGDEVVIEGEWSRVPSPGNPGQYDWRASLARQQIHGRVRAKPHHGIVVLRHGQGEPWLAAVFHLRARWERLIRESFTAEESGLLLSLLLGQRGRLEDALNDAFVETGTVHLLVISGFNVGLIALLLEGLFRVAGLPWRLRLLLSAVGLGGYCVLTGMQPPVVRATLMAWVVLGAYALDRVLSWFNAMAAAALVIVWLNPTQLFDPGFQLSFGAVLSLLVFTSRWQPWLAGHLGWVRPGWLRRYLSLSVSATAAIWVGLAPILAWYFHLVSPVSMLANLLIAPLISALIAVGTTLLVLSTFFEPVIAWGQGIVSLLLTATVRCVTWCHSIPGGWWLVGQPSPFVLLGYYGLLGLSIFRARLGWSPGRVLVVWLAALTIWVWAVLAQQLSESHWLRVTVLDVGHGDSLVVRTPRGHTLLVDAGSQEAGRFQLIPFLRHHGITTLDGLVLTHADEDHLGGAIPLLQGIRVRRLLTNGAIDDTMSARAVRSLAAARGIQETVVADGMTVEAGPGVAIEVLHPPHGLVPGTAPASNDNSIVLKLTKGTVSLLLTGDIEEAGLPWLLRNAGSLRATVLKVPHHGSRLGTIGATFFETVQPALALLSVGRVHHLPAPETIEALHETGAIIYSTRDEGAIELRTDGVHLEVRTFKGSRTWQSLDVRL